MKQAGKSRKRMSNTNLKSRRQRSWTQGEQRRAERKKMQEAAHKRNLADGITPWQQAKAERLKRRAAYRAAHPKGTAVVPASR